MSSILMRAAVVIAAVCVFAPPPGAQANDEPNPLAVVKRQMQDLRESYERQTRALEARIKDLESLERKAVQRTEVGTGLKPLPRTQPVAASRRRAAVAQNSALASPSATARRSSSNGLNFQIGLSGSVAGGGSSAGSDLIGGLQNGHHDPNRNGFTLQNAELFLGGSVDPYFDAQANITLVIDEEGETVVELEEAFAKTRALPAGLQVKAGHYYTEFGRANPMHPHSWDFVDKPVILSRLFGPDGLRSQGARVSWLSPLPWFSEFTVGVQNAGGETLRSFLGNEQLSIRGTDFMERSTDDPGDLLYSARWLNGFDLSDETSVNIGVSGVTGPNATGTDTRTHIMGADVYVKWRPERNERGFPFVAFHSEMLYRKFEFMDPGSAGHAYFQDWGVFGQATYGFRPGWVAGLRGERASGNGDDPSDADSDSRWRLSPNLTWYPTEFSKVRLQYNRDWADHLDATEGGSADSIWLQLEFSLGGHFAHTF